MENLYQKWFNVLNSEETKSKIKTITNEITYVLNLNDEMDATYFLLWKKDPDGNSETIYYSFHLYPLDGDFDPIDTCWHANNIEGAFNQLLLELKAMMVNW